MILEKLQCSGARDRYRKQDWPETQRTKGFIYWDSSPLFHSSSTCVCVCVRAGTQAHTWNLHRCIHPCTPNTHSHTQSFLATISTRDACTSTIEGDFHLLLEVLCFPAHPSLILEPNMATELWWWKERICFLYFLFTLLADTNVFLVSWKFDECLSASLEGPGMARVPGEVVPSLSCPVHKALLTKQHYTLYVLSLKESWEAFLGLTP